MNYNKLLIQPIILPTMINQAELNLYLIITNREIANIDMLKPSTNDAVTSLKVTTSINAKEAMFIPSNIDETQMDFLNLGIIGFNIITNKKEGINIPIVANTAPKVFPSKYPMKVAVVNTGPGVNCPTATESINC